MDHTRDSASPPLTELHAVVVVDQFDASTQQALLYAEALDPQTLIALNVCVDETRTGELVAQWARRRIDTPFTSIHPTTPDPALEYVADLQQRYPEAMIVVVFPVVAVRRWWLRALHRPADPSLPHRLAALDRVLVAEVPWQLDAR